MRRPGPRPYECVRRAWHSERHQPVRGSLIQEIFRVVNEIHSTSTKKNKEWQEKLPVVVLKAEEIMYSKANSEAEYMDLKTLWERANDAINTIIRRDESSETAGLLQPCIEAALNLGCMPRRASRSQRNSNTGCYLSPNTQELNSVFPGIVDSTSQEIHSPSAQFMSHCPNFIKPRNTNPTYSGLKLGNHVGHNNDYNTKNFPFSFESVDICGSSQCLAMETYLASNSCSVYPLHYGNCLHAEDSDVGFGVPSKLNPNTMGSAEMGVLQNPFSCNLDASSKSTQADSRYTFEHPTENDCDLSLRLGPLSVPCRVDNRWPLEVEDGGSCSYQEGKKFRDRLPLMDFSKQKTGIEHLNVEALMRKRKAIISHDPQDSQFCWQSKLPYNQFAREMRNAGL